MQPVEKVPLIFTSPELSKEPRSLILIGIFHPYKLHNQIKWRAKSMPQTSSENINKPYPISLSFRPRDTQASFTWKTMEKSGAHIIPGGKKCEKAFVAKRQGQERGAGRGWGETNRQNEAESVYSEMSQVTYEPGQQNKSRPHTCGYKWINLIYTEQ